MTIYNDFDIQIEENDILRLLGYKDEYPEGELLGSIRNGIESCSKYIRPAVTCEKFGIKEKYDDKVILDNSVVFEGEYIASKLKKCDYVVITVTTIGKEIDSIIKSSFENGDYLKGMIADSIGTTAVEYINKAMWNKLISNIKDTDMGITSRLSPGSGGWDIKGQKGISASVDASKIGVRFTDSYLMVPLKSTSVMYGFGKGIGITRADHICSECNMKNCRYRMDGKVEIRVNDRLIYVKRGTNLLDALRCEKIHIQSTCGGKGICGKCKVLFKEGAPRSSEIDKRHLGLDEIKNGIRLACGVKIFNPAQIETFSEESMDVLIEGGSMDINIDPYVSKKYMVIDKPTLKDQRSDCRRLSDSVKTDDIRIKESLMSKISETLRKADYNVTASLYKNVLVDIDEGDTSGVLYGVSVDIGTTTIACYLTDLRTGKVLSVESGVNRQRVYGADVISRINYTIENDDGLRILHDAVVGQINEMIKRLCVKSGIKTDYIYNMTVVGNTTMIHLFLGLPPKNISLSPYIAVTCDAVEMEACDAGIDINGYVTVLPGVASYVGSDITAGILACGMMDSDKYSLLLDLGTNGEIALGNSDGIVACATAAGPAFEGANIKWGTAGIRGAISSVDLSKRTIYKTIGNEKPCGICGSGVLDMVSELLKFGVIDETGRMADDDDADFKEPIKKRMRINKGMKEFVLEGDIVFTQKDVREVQLASAAVSAGTKILLKEKGLSPSDVENVYIAGGFGNFMRVGSALNIGLLLKEFSGKVKSIGNSAGTGARMYLMSRECSKKIDKIIQNASYIELSGRQDFQEYFVDSMMLGGQ